VSVHRITHYLTGKDANVSFLERKENEVFDWNGLLEEWRNMLSKTGNSPDESRKC
jgi:hypothetical protein